MALEMPLSEYPFSRTPLWPMDQLFPKLNSLALHFSGPPSGVEMFDLQHLPPNLTYLSIKDTNTIDFHERQMRVLPRSLLNLHLPTTNISAKASEFFPPSLTEIDGVKE